MVISKEEIVTSIENPERPILDFLDREKVDGIPNKIFPLIVIDIMSSCDVSKILIDQKISYDIMYANLF